VRVHAIRRPDRMVERACPLKYFSWCVAAITGAINPRMCVAEMA
jgi:hypothetical protein